MTNEQKQCLLKYLGYYKKDIDGVFGAGSKQATKEFQIDYGMEGTGVFDSATEKLILEAIAGTAQKAEPVDTWDGIKYFKREEFRCTCGGKYCNGFPAEPSRNLLLLADRIRDHYGVPMIVSSGVRCAIRNAQVGGASASRHMRGLAMDFCIKGKTADQVLEYVWKQPETNYAYKIDANYVHMDVGE